MLHKFSLQDFPIESLYSWLILPFSELVALVLVAFFVLFAYLEIHFPRVSIPLPAWHRSNRTNISLFIFNSTVLSILSVPSLLLLADQYAELGLLNTIPPTVWKTILAFMLLDLIWYLWHRACHSFDLLWEFHKIHHCDPDLNVSTSFRVHILEIMIGITIKAVYVIVLGVDKMTLLAYEAVTTFFVMFHHANIVMPGEQWLSRMIIVPSLHRVHHSKLREEHDQNYGSVLSIWDWLFGTRAVLEPEAIGIKGNPPLDFLRLVKFGFLPSAESPVSKPNLQAMIADAAYFISLSREGGQNQDLDDWLQAEQEINAREDDQKRQTQKLIWGKDIGNLFSIRRPRLCA
jgi:sterol desaturase/sphingolipid hydroxylase (fatty acid hydroxylase superfamily)